MIALNAIAVMIISLAGLAAIALEVISYRDLFSVLSHTGMFMIGIVFGVASAALVLLRMYDDHD